jgi:hypothetical protein
MGNWAQLPWVGIFNPNITSSAQSGYYIVYLFKENMEGVYLSLNQGVTDYRNKFGDKTALVHLKKNAKEFREKLNISEDLKEDITLGNGNYAKFYEAGNIYAKYYPKDELPSDEILKSDLREFFKLYDLINIDPLLKIIENPAEIKEAQNKLLEILYQKANEVIPIDKGLTRDKSEVSAHWSNDLGIWVVNRELEDHNNRYMNAFGINKPNVNNILQVVCEINIPKEGINKNIAGAFAKDLKNNLYLIHRGNIAGINKTDVFDKYTGQTTQIQE